jgi:two-component system sensor histidine kinase/response regulator
VVRVTQACRYIEGNVVSESIRKIILVASASADERQHLESVLRQDGCEVIQAATGEEVVRCFRERQPDVVLLHEALQSPSGVDICRVLKGEPDRLVSLVVMRTPGGQGRGESTGYPCADDVVSLPLDPVEVKIRVGKALERLRVMRLLREDTRRIHELEQARDELTQLIVRDMKAPLTGLADLLEMADRASVGHFKSEASQYINEALDATETLEEMVAFLLDVRHMLAGELKLKRRRCDVAQMVRGTADLLGEAAQAAGVPVEVIGEPVFAICDERLMGRAIRHLVRTAILMCPKGNAVRVEVGGDAAGIRLVVLCDGGVGEVVQASGLADMMRSSEAPVSSGLGLAFCRLVMGAHGGKFGVDSHRGGVSWWLTIPAGVEVSVASQAECERDRIPEDVSLQRSRRYLGGGDAASLSVPSRCIASQTTRYQFAVAVAIMSAIPLLAFGYLLTDAVLKDTFNIETLLLMTPAIVALVAMGIVLLIRHTMEIARLRQYLEVMARGGAPKGHGWAASADFKAMGKALNSVMAQAGEKVRVIEAQSKALLQSEQQRVMVETVGAACHHLGQPATVLGVYLDLMKKKESSPEMQQLIAECQLAASDVAGILHRLQSVAHYQTEPYLLTSQLDVKRSDERILKI